MKRTFLTTDWLMIGLLLLPFIYLAIIWPQLPSYIPGHYGPDGKPDRYDPKDVLALLLAGSTVVMYIVMRFVPRLDPRAGLNTELYQKIRWCTMVFWAVFLAWFWTISWKGVGPETLVNSVGIGIGLLLAVLGNLLNSIKPNYFVGIRTPWTLESPVVWQRTHRLGARVLVVGGLLISVLVLLMPPSVKMGFILGVTAITALVPVIYSYIYFRQEKARA